MIQPQFEAMGPFSEGMAALLRGNVWGYLNKMGEVAIIRPEFQAAGKFADGLAQVLVNDKWGYIDKAGRFAIRPQFENGAASVEAIDTRSFSEGLAGVLMDGKWGFIDKTGKTIIPPQFEEVRPFSDGLAVIRMSDKNERQ